MDRTSRLAECVARGAVWMDEHRDGWAARMDLGKLDMASCVGCVLGQEFGLYTDGLFQVVSDVNAHEGAVLHGFNAELSARGEWADFEDLERLRLLWIDAIMSRRAKAAITVGNAGRRKGCKSAMRFNHREDKAASACLTGAVAALTRNVKRLRKAASMTQFQLAVKAGVSLSVVTGIEQGISKQPLLLTVLALARALDVPVTDLLVAAKLKPNKTVVTEEDFHRYLAVQHSGRFNMLAEWPRAARAAKLAEETYKAICENYAELRDRYGDPSQAVAR